MDEGGTLDFEDLMDTGDEFPGFEITKFTPANENDGNDDGVLRTPEHERDDDYDYAVSESKRYSSTPENERSDHLYNGTEITDQEVKETTYSETGDMTETASTDNVECCDNKEADIPKPTETGDHKPDRLGSDLVKTIAVEESADEHSEENVTQHSEENVTFDSNEEEMNDVELKEDDFEPVLKKKKLYLKPPQKKAVTENVNSEGLEETFTVELNETDTRDSLDGDSSRGSDCVTQNGQTEALEEEEEFGETEGNDKDDKSPHQQSFLSFLNLKPGSSSKPRKEEMKKEESLQQEFFSRKRLRTRKKVSYCEDVVAEDDDAYNVDEDDEEYDDHEIESTDSGRARNNTRRNSATANYAKALQNLLPGVDLSCLQNNQVQNNQVQNNRGNQVQNNRGMQVQNNRGNQVQNNRGNQVQNNRGNQVQNNRVQVNRVNNKNDSIIVPVMSTKSNIDLLKQHGNLKGLFECGICGIFFNTASQFINHQETVHAGEKKEGRSAMETFRCEICGFVLTNRFAYLEHKKMKHQRGNVVTFNCSKCKISKFTDMTALRKHQEMCGSPFCSTCGLTFKAWVDVAEHRKQAHSATPSLPSRQWLNCVSKTCTFKCATQIELTQHIKLRHAATFTCNAPRCALVFASREELVEHKKEAHASEFIVQYQCMECKNCFSSKTLLAEHQYLHTSEKLRKCDLCLRQFGSILELRKHKDVHTAKSNMRCGACFRWCEDKVTLINHVCSQKRRNTGIRLYFCDVCHKDFRSDEKMFTHRKEHKNFFQCGSCFSVCNSESEYFEHRQTHGKFTCKECCEEMDEKDVEMHRKAHKYYIKLEEMENDGINEKVMFLCPNLFSAIQT